LVEPDSVADPVKNPDLTSETSGWDPVPDLDKYSAKFILEIFVYEKMLLKVYSSVLRSRLLFRRLRV
jgi:hypothetical protein